MELENDFIITQNDLRIHRNLYGGCVPGWKTFAAKYNINFKDFIRNGISAKILLNTNDSMAEEVVRRAYERRRG